MKNLFMVLISIVLIFLSTQVFSMAQIQPEDIQKDRVVDYSQVNRFLVQDAVGHQQTLYLDDEETVKAAGLYRGEMPPPAPDFDVRFKNTRGMVETYPSVLDPNVQYEYPISVNIRFYPIKVMWEIWNPVERKMILLADGRYVVDMEGRGFVRMQNAKEITIQLGLSTNVSYEQKNQSVFSLAHNYPNPFNPQTKISFSVPKESYITLKVYDLLGREVATLVNEKKQQGEYSITWSAEGVPSGVYYYRLEAGNFIEIKKLVLVR